MTEAEPLQQVERTYVRFRGRKLSYFSGCDYFRLASHPEVLQAVWSGARRFGLNVAASRLTSGNHALYARLERRLARFFGADDALLVSSGYLTNLVVAQALARQFSHALLDERAHPSLADAAHFLECPVLRFRHRDSDSVASSVSRCGPGARLLLLTDGMFSHDGTAAPLAEYLKVLPRDAVILVDDAHGAGVLGRNGRGSLEHAGVNRNRFIQTLSLSKAFGAFGGAILGNAKLRRKITSRSAMFAGSTPLPLPLANAALQSVELLSRDVGFRRRLEHNMRFLQDGLRQAGLPVGSAPGPIIALAPGSERATANLRRTMLSDGIYPPFIKYPGGPAEGYFRFVISSEHTPQQLEQLIRVLATAATGLTAC